MSNPYLILGPALISFSGGRTSAYMLRKILDAHKGKLPADVIIGFSNTGKEREKTLRFVHNCETYWGIKVYWVEWTDDEAGYKVVGYNSASRSGEPFAALTAKRGFLPNSVARFCSVTLKVRAMRNFIRGEFGWKHWNNIIGLRYDEGHRVLKALARNDTNKEPFKAVMPMSRAKATVRDVAVFWEKQPFDLGLQSYEGNCDMCFLKSQGKLKRLIRDNPGMVDWWKEQEQIAATTATGAGKQFNQDRSFASLEREVTTQPYMPGLIEDDEEYDVECGLTCGMEDAA